MEVFIDLILNDVGGSVANNQHGALAGGDRGTLERRGNRMRSQELNHIYSLLIHLQEDNKSLRYEMRRIHEREKRMLKLVNRYLRNLMRFAGAHACYSSAVS